MTQSSPGIEIKEIDLTASAQQEASTVCSFAGRFGWGPILQRVRISDETNLVARFGEPSDINATDFLTAASVLAYTNTLDVVRVGATGESFNAVSSGVSAVSILNDEDYDVSAPSLASIEYVAKYAGALGNSLAVASCVNANDYQQTLPGTFSFTRSKQVGYTPAASETLSDYFNPGDFIVVDGVRYAVASILTSPARLNLVKVYVGSTTPTSVARLWQYASLVAAAPASGLAHIVVVDEDGLFTKEAGAVLEVYESVSLAPGAKNADGSALFYKDVINNKSNFVRAGGVTLTNANPLKKVVKQSFTLGSEDSIGVDDYIKGYELFQNSEEVDASLIVSGESIKAGNAVLANYLIDNLADVRRDVMVCVSPSKESVVNNRGNEVEDIIADRRLLSSTSFAQMDSGWKYMYDKYNDKFRWVPLNGDVAGVYSRVDRDRDPWFSGAGEARGVIKNVVKLAFSPDKAQRDRLYPNDINPITDFNTSGPTLFGDKTLLGKNSAFNRVGVRRLFTVLEKTIGKAARFALFEFNDQFTRAQFVALVEPFLRDVKGRRGIADFRVICDETNNTPQVIAGNRFVGTILVRPNYSVNFIELKFVAVGPTVSFEIAAGIAA